MKPASIYTKPLQLIALFGIALIQPVLSVLANSPEFFIAHKMESWEIIFLTFFVCVVAPSALGFFCTAIDYILPRVGAMIYFIVILLIAALFAFYLLNSFFALSLPLLIVVGLIFSFGFAAFIFTSQDLSRFLSFLGILVACIIPINFLFFSPVSDIVRVGTLGPTDFPSFSADTPIVLVVFDEFNLSAILEAETQIDRVRFPNFAAFADGATWFPNATTASPYTAFALPAVLTGKRPGRDRSLPNFSSHPDNLLAWLGSNYDANIIEAVTNLCPDEVCETIARQDTPKYVQLTKDVLVVYAYLILPAHLHAEFLPSLENDWKGFGAAELNQSRQLFANASKSIRGGRHIVFDTFLNEIEAGNGTVDFLHILLPHIPYDYLSDGRAYQGGATVGLAEGNKWQSNDLLVSQAYWRYLQQVGFVDKFIKRLVSRLEETGKYDEALVILTADHGSSFVPGQSVRNLSNETAASVLRVPLMVKLPFQKEGRVDLRHASNVDIAATIADVLDVTLPWLSDGVSLVSDAFPERYKLEYVFGEDPKNDFSISLDQLDLSEVLEWKDKRFGFGIPLHDTVLRTEFNQLKGQHVSELSVSQQTVGTFRSEDLSLIKAPSDLQNYVPALLRGIIEGIPKEQAEYLAISLNGNIVTTARTFEDKDGVLRLSTVLPISKFKDQNSVKIFSILMSDEHVSLREIKQAETEKFDLLTESDGSQKLISSSGRTYHMGSDTMHGYFGQVTKSQSGMFWSGWAADKGNKTPASKVLLFFNGVFIEATSVNIPRQDVAAQMGFGTNINFGYQFYVPNSINFENGGFRLVAISEDGRANDLTVHPKVLKYVEGSEANTYEIMASSNGSERVISSSGDIYKLNDSGITGYLDNVEKMERGAIWSGWAVQTSTEMPVSKVLIFTNGKFLKSTKPNLLRQDVARSLGIQKEAYFGYRIYVPEFLGLDPDTIRIVALSEDDKASDLIISADLLP